MHLDEKVQINQHDINHHEIKQHDINHHDIKHYDIAILGGGLAGLSLAVEFCAPHFSHLNIVIIEPRAEYRRDKTWSYWRQQSQNNNEHFNFAYSEQECATWPAWRLESATQATQTHTTKADSYIYASINSDAFYQAALAKIQACGHITLLQNNMVDSMRSEGDKVVLALKNATNMVINQFVFDSRPANNVQSNAHVEHKHLTQHFLGLEVIANNAIFDTQYVDLMQFQAAKHGIHFMYVLPYSPTRALIESTWICSHHHHNDYTQELNQYLNKRWPNTQFEIAYTEAGSLPLMAAKNNTYWLGSVQVIPIGSLAGTARAATGYAFLETLKDNQRLADAVKNQQLHNKQLIPNISQPIASFKRNVLDAWMDTLFLTFLSKNAALGPHYFVQMFARCQPASLIRFLSGSANMVDRLKVIWAMPSLPMIKHAFGYYFK